MSQEELSKKVFIGRTTICHYERVKTDINFENLEKIANACGYDIIFQNRKYKKKRNIIIF